MWTASRTRRRYTVLPPTYVRLLDVVPSSPSPIAIHRPSVVSSFRKCPWPVSAFYRVLYSRFLYLLQVGRVMRQFQFPLSYGLSPIAYVHILLLKPAAGGNHNNMLTRSAHWQSQRISSFLTECASLQINILPLAISNTTMYSFGSAPYYLMAFEPDGFTTTTFVGTDHSNLTWQVNHAAGQSHQKLIDISAAQICIGTRLMLSMADSLGNSGGVGSQLHNELYTVVCM